MKKITLLALVLISLSTAYSQDGKITWGEEIKDKKFFIKNVLAVKNNETYVLMETRSRGIGYKINKLDKNFNLVSSSPVSLLIGDKKHSINQILYINGRVYFFSSLYDKKIDKNILYVSISQLDGSCSPPKVIDEISSKSKKRAGDFGITISPDSSKVLIINTDEYVKNKEETYNLKVYSTDFDDPLWKEEVKELNRPLS